MTAPVVPGQAVALRVLLQANPSRDNDPEWWRVSDVVRQAEAVYGCAFPQKSASTCITQTLARNGYVQSKRGVRGAVLYSLTAEVRLCAGGVQGLHRKSSCADTDAPGAAGTEPR